MLRQRGAATGLDWDFAPLVKGPGGYGGRASVGGHLVAGQTPHREQAWTVIRELVSKENQVAGAQLQGLQPSRKSVADSWEQLYPGKNARIARLMAETAPPDPRSFWKDGDEVGPILEGKYMDATFIRNELPVQEAMRRAMAEIRSYYGVTASR